jgi:hypothetical protein
MESGFQQGHPELERLAGGPFEMGPTCDRWHLRIGFTEKLRTGATMGFVSDFYFFDLGFDILSVNFKTFRTSERRFRPAMESIVRSIRFPGAEGPAKTAAQ